MRHIFRQLASTPLCTHFVVQPSGFGFLIPRTRRALLFRPRQRSTRRAIPVAAVAAPTDHHFPMTTLAVEDPAILFGHPGSAHERALQGTGGREMLQSEHRNRQQMSPAVPMSQGARGGVLDPHPTQPLTRLSHNPAHLTSDLTERCRKEHIMPTQFQFIVVEGYRWMAMVG
jgi:hypothetical protein